MTYFVQSGKIKYPKGKTTYSQPIGSTCDETKFPMDYKKGEYISLEEGELKIMNKEIGKHLETAGKEANKKQREIIEQSDLLESQLKELEKLGTIIYQGQLSHGIHGVLHDPDKLKQFLTNFYHKIRKEEQKSKILAIEKKMLKDPDFPINKLIQKEREKIIEIIKVADEKREDGMGSISKVRYATPLELKKDILTKLK
uniref:Uncharacterized protein n=1 Tax=viral metagenome TaxID=1070528 RepID=A0A6M3LNI2_9ZZZZ